MTTSFHPREERPVNFGDFDSAYNDHYDADTRTRTADASSMLTNQTSGVLAYDHSAEVNEHGQTAAELVAYDYRSSPINSSPSMSRLVRRQSEGFESTPRTSQYGKDYAASSVVDAMTYIDEDFNYYPSRNTRQSSSDKQDISLMHNAAVMGGERNSRSVEDMEYQDPLKPNDLGSQQGRKSGFARFFADGLYPLEQRIENKRRGIGRQRYPFVVWLLTTVMVSVFIYELVLNGRQQRTPISLKPVVNPMLGPSESALINLGARFPPCMKNVTDVPVTLLLPCMNDTANPPDRVCPISDLCGFGGIHNDNPNQWFRFITPIFLHAGIIHIALNMLAQLMVSAQIEREMGSGGFFITYFAAGIFGNVLGGNFALVGVPSLGASGAIFGTVAVTWVDLFAHWKFQYKPKTKLIYMAVELVIGIGIGFIPYVDNFAHLGGFLMGLLVGTFFYPVISTTRRHKLAMYGFRIAALPLVIILYVVLIRNFYTSDPYAACSGCRYLSCIPTSANNHCKGTGITTTTTGSTGLRMLLL